jgi:hypothetical protein
MSDELKDPARVADAAEDIFVRYMVPYEPHSKEFVIRCIEETIRAAMNEAPDLLHAQADRIEALEARVEENAQIIELQKEANRLALGAAHEFKEIATALKARVKELESAYAERDKEREVFLGFLKAIARPRGWEPLGINDDAALWRSAVSHAKRILAAARIEPDGKE